METGRPGLGQGRVFKTQAWEQRPPQKNILELACSSQHPLTPQVGLPGPAPAGRRSPFWNSSRQSPGRWEGEGSGLLFSEPSCGALTHRPARGKQQRGA